MKLPPTFAADDHLNVIIETPEGSAGKLAFDPAHGLFVLSKVIPTGLSFPLPFGFVPGSKAEDGDPLDALVLVEPPTWPGEWIEARVLGIIEAEQTDDGVTVRNDRIITVAVASRRYAHAARLSDLGDLPGDIVAFFTEYHERCGGAFRSLRIAGPEAALKRVRELG
jgi:inorganic pyrophosphatase